MLFVICLHLPQSFSKESIQHIVDSLKITTCRGVAMNPLGHIAEKRPLDLIQHDDVLIEHMLADSIVATQGGQILVQLAAVAGVSTII